MTRLEELLEDTIVRMPDPRELRARAARRRTRRVVGSSTLAAAVAGFAFWAYQPGEEVREVEAAAQSAASPEDIVQPAGIPMIEVVEPPGKQASSRRLPTMRLSSMSDLWPSMECEQPQGRPGPPRHHSFAHGDESEDGSSTLTRVAHYATDRQAKEDLKDLQRVLAACGLKARDMAVDRPPFAWYEGRDAHGQKVTVLVQPGKDWLTLTETVAPGPP
ncbi:hypothetical protein [Streptomyces sp. NPDC002490]|uniref:hypothetical protein n=1 Tax=Streptomyces sp. NPDC002490 TaxID=3154416 RepID=UPI00331AB223